MHQPSPSSSSSSSSYLPLPSSPPLRAPRPTLSTLPPHILLQIVYSTFPQSDFIDQTKLERQRKTLYWLATALRLVDRSFYVACMNVLRSIYLPVYTSLVRAPYSSDPFPLLSPHYPSTAIIPPYSATATEGSSAPHASSLHVIQRETATLDHFIALKVREDVWADESELHLERDESFKDLFDFAQPKARLEDLVRTYGVREGLVTLARHLPRSSSVSTSASKPRPQRSSSSSTPLRSPSQSQPTSFLASLFTSKHKHKAPPQQQQQQPQQQATKPKLTPLPFHLLSVSFSLHKVGLLLATQSSTGRRNTIVETHRSRDEKLEAAAKRLVKELRVYLSENA